MGGIDVEAIRRDFPILKRVVNGYPLAYLDSAATSLKPRQVVEAIAEFYNLHNANVGRGLHTLAREASELYESARREVARFIGARGDEVVFVRNATEAINMVAFAYCFYKFKRGDAVVVTQMEHHSNIVPWIMLSRLRGVEVRVAPVTTEGTLDYCSLEELAEGARLIAVTHASNVLGTINDVKRIARIAHREGALCLVDGAQSVPHMPVNVGELGCDFLAFSGHKMLGPTGIGVLYARRELLEEFEPFMGGGGMIGDVVCEPGQCTATWASAPQRLEAGTPNIAGAVGLAAAVEYLKRLGMEAVRRHEEELTSFLLEELEAMKGVTVLGPLDPGKRTGLVAFTVSGFSPHEVAAILDLKGIAVRSGHHCAIPVHRLYGLEGSVRASFYVYNTLEEVERLVNVLKGLTGG